MRRVFFAFMEWLRVRRQRERLDKLRAFAQQLPRGEITTATFFAGGKATVVGEVEDRPFELTVRFHERPVMIFELRLRSTARPFQAAMRYGFERVTSSDGLLRAEVPFSDDELDLARLVERCRALGRIAKSTQPAARPTAVVHGQRCPTCRHGLEENTCLESCVACGTPQHRVCIEARGCTVQGCAGARQRPITRSFKRTRF